MRIEYKKFVSLAQELQINSNCQSTLIKQHCIFLSSTGPHLYKTNIELPCIRTLKALKYSSDLILLQKGFYLYHSCFMISPYQSKRTTKGWFYFTNFNKWKSPKTTIHLFKAQLLKILRITTLTAVNRTLIFSTSRNSEESFQLAAICIF